MQVAGALAATASGAALCRAGVFIGSSRAPRGLRSRSGAKQGSFGNESIAGFVSPPEAGVCRECGRPGV